MNSLLIIINLTIVLHINETNGYGRNFTFIYRNYLQHMLDTIDSEVKPCTNFFEHACGNFKKKPQLFNDFEENEEFSQLIEYEEIPPFLYNRQDQFKFFIENKNEFRTKTGVMLRDLYDLCKLSEGLSQIHLWNQFLNEIPFLTNDHEWLTKWPFLRFQWIEFKNELNLDWILLAAEFAAHGFNTFLEVFFVQNTIYIGPNEHINCPDHKEFINDLIPLLGQRNIQIAYIIANELRTFCRQLNGEISSSIEISMIETDTEIFKEQTLNKYFEKYFLSLNFSNINLEKSRKITIKMQYLNEMFILLQATEDRIIYNFVLWYIRRQFHINDCFQLIESFEHLLITEYWNWHVFELSQINRDVSLASYLFHITRFQKYRRKILLSNQWDHFLSTKLERKDFNIERLIKSYARDYLNPANIKFLNFSILILYRPMIHYYATLAYDMWLESSLLYNTDAFYAMHDCLQRQTTLQLYANDANDENDHQLYQIVNEKQGKEIYKFYTSFIAILQDYQFWLEGENFSITEDFILEYFKFDSSRIMFYAVAQQYCNRNDHIFNMIINRSFMNMPEFHEAFNCSDDTTCVPKNQLLYDNPVLNHNGRKNMLQFTTEELIEKCVSNCINIQEINQYAALQEQLSPIVQPVMT
uniref:Peptidase M13 N-terminal domain-containing protein n=1 Tax=Glossina brevipalpis TaxID=37001 RepID=A0A1A9WPR4_9MUSC